MVRRIMQGGEEWVSVHDIGKALNDNDLILKAAAMLKVSKEAKHDSALKSIQMMIAYFFTEATGILRHTEN